MTCPNGQTSVAWAPTRDRWGNNTIHIGCHRQLCSTCSRRPLCTRAKATPREVTLRPCPLHESLQKIRGRQETEAWRAQYGKRAGVESTLSQAVRTFGLRRGRYRGLPKTNLQYVFTAIAIHLMRLDAWLNECHFAKPRRSAFTSLAPTAGAA